MPVSPVRIACFGDSLTEGYGLAHDEALPAVLERMLHDDGIEASCLNFGVSGDTSEDGLRRIKPVIEAKPDAAIVEFGANDCFVGDSIDEVHANLSTIIERLQAEDIPLLLVGITAEICMDEAYTARFNPIFRQLADTYALPLFPDILSCYYDDPMKKLMDGMHPNAQGVESIARDILPQVRELIAPITA
ncbi:arylesterase [uncultured Pseudodesulfovibrio sp.]|uniref:arylesterase n=1 Tax=uncultured Pseudodesulfovibrio sp. TaxID=2035858 RepID=UPI0029C63D76|nr:arylesterase [uncultured Pseudodesulfovibrio sp.]